MSHMAYPEDATPTGAHTPMSASSNSTLVNDAPDRPALDTSGAPRTNSATSPFSASFDPNGPTPTTPTALLAAHGIVPHSSSTPHGAPPSANPHSGAAHAVWTHRLSASFGAIADQIAAASRALATVEVPAGLAPIPEGVPTTTATTAPDDAGETAARMDRIERAQEELAGELEAVQARLARMQRAAEMSKESEAGEDGALRVAVDGGAIEELRKSVEGIVETIKLDQARLYARLLNATVTANKMAIRAPIMANGKLPPNFPATKGEFEHLTKERYEALLKCYNQPIKGDTNAKREALRQFIGLTPAV